ncbi:hypothetical protein COU62_00175 [Candidatus Pacearchaeota archaeon CG10_big_fil_rev_8_21_14_0_10_35_219]|nr:hypothetical protein [Candidatus Pacearchaeota archaeon]OIO41835.1 MAG: hypothetical protein AUJ63_04735 [Candidatus Pacearchaeota archaeon CG1_02_35_32]PIO08491.1 MAG: hypothetical protein COU62_00175 [Candidatus Pacearchaeota archaeon CG10_big_fil_rev_8_21_14_0_10_35_219]PIY81794.1 MAG: hypothetical protein COY79_00635 [Candidatus Pacearchaeota archaeon CG_4_10_14_0_8_um_filter_35_169]PIZ80089.1 MAG: hypothetical protein COY00_02360 [Candidatus Pacearchaeota archaeon CG_4_10_14_0_2_um_filt
MTSEYVKLNRSEKIMGQKDLLNCEVLLLDSIKRMQNYKELRKEELAAKIVLKKKANEAVDEIKVLEKVLPKTKDTKDEEEPKKKTSTERRQDLELEIDEIMRKIETLK